MLTAKLGMAVNCTLKVYHPATKWDAFKARVFPEWMWPLLGGINRRLVKVIRKKNDVKDAFKNALASGVVDNNFRCARKIRILDNPVVVATETATRTSGGTGTSNTFTKNHLFTNGGSTTYTIDVVKLMDSTNAEYAEATLGAAVSYPPGGQIDVDYTCTFTNDGTKSATLTSYFTYQLAYALGQDSDIDNMACGGFNGGEMKFDYTGGANNPKQESMICVSVTTGDDTNPYIVNFSSTFTDAADNAVTPSSVKPLPTDLVEAHAMYEQTAGFTGDAAPHDLTVGLVINCALYVTE